MSLSNKGRCLYLDLFKFFLCYLVIAIHLVGESYSHFPLYRLAVPMFFLISGYFMRGDGMGSLENAKKLVFRTARYMLIGFAFYIVFDFVGCLLTEKGVGYYFTTLFYEDFLLEFFILNRPITYTGAQLWFLIALFCVSLIHYGLTRLGALRYYRLLIPICYCIYFFFAGYMYLIQNTDMPIRYTRNALFFGLPCFALGYEAAGWKVKKGGGMTALWGILGVGFFFLQIVEDRLLRVENTSLEMYVSGVLSALCLLFFFLSLPAPRAEGYYKWVGKSAPFSIYILHMAVAVVLSELISFRNLLFKSLVVLLVSFLIYEALHLSLMAWRACAKSNSEGISSRRSFL